MPDKDVGGVRCLGGDPYKWSDKCKAYEKLLIERKVKDRYSGSFVGDFHAIVNYGGVYSYFLQEGKAKIRLYYEWLPLAFIAKALGGDFLMIDDSDITTTMEDVELLTKDIVKQIHARTCAGLLGSKKAVNWFNEIK
jgi:fructose-1,6-bisphosphatase